MSSLEVSRTQPQNARPDYLANPFLTDAQRAKAELQSVLKQRHQSSALGAPTGKPKRSSKGQLLAAGGIVLACVGLIVNWFFHHFPTVASQPSAMNMNMSYPSGPAALLNRLPMAPPSAQIGYHPNYAALPPAGFHSQGSAAAYGLPQYHASKGKKGKHSARAKGGALYLVQKHGRWFVQQ